MAAFFGANEIWSTYEGDGREPVILVGVRELDAKEPVSEEEFEHSLSELAELAKACEMNPVDTVTQSLAHINTGLYVGAGKADEIRIGAEMFGAQRVIFNDTLSPSQIRNLQKLLKLLKLWLKVLTLHQELDVDRLYSQQKKLLKWIKLERRLSLFVKKLLQMTLPECMLLRVS